MYCAKVNWYNSYDNEDKIDYVFLFADDWNEAMAKINSQFEYINSVEIEIFIRIVIIIEHLTSGGE